MPQVFSGKQTTTPKPKAREMAAAEEWRARVWDRASEAAGRCGHARGLLAVAVGRLAQPMRAAHAPVDRVRALVTEDLLVDAYGSLAVAASLMAAAKLVALRGAAATPEEPLRSIEEINMLAEPNLRVALARLRTATTRAGRACLAVERGRGHLWTAYLLLDFDRLPGVDVFLEAERAAAHHEINTARALAEECATLARAAYHLLG
ncbi:hypothetical protein EJB05_08648, partial [Eragrostis curvula]